MGKIKKKIIDKISGEYIKVMDGLSEITIEQTIKKDLYLKAISNKKRINEQYIVFLNKYIKVCEYLLYDFKVIKTKFNKETIFLKEEIDLKTSAPIFIKEKPARRFKKLYKIYNKLTSLPVLDYLSFYKLLRKWHILSCILIDYPFALSLLQDKCKSTIYKDIKIFQEYGEIELNKDLIEDLSFLMKK